MIASELTALLSRESLTFLTGVPCSYLGSLLSNINHHPRTLKHIIAASEGEAIGIASGYHLATGKVPVVYLQNSGLGNAVNPLTSLMDTEVYSIPCILFLSWRGEPGITDEPQHKKMGRIMLDLLDDMGIPYLFADNDIEKTKTILRKLKRTATDNQKPVALIFRSDVIDKSPDTSAQDTQTSSLMKREEILDILLPKIGTAPIISTTGKTSRELFELRTRYGQSHQYDFLTVGSMGCASGIGLGVAQHTSKQVFVIDGDGAALMKLGTLATIGHYQPKNLVHIIIDNGAHESTGGQPTVSPSLQWPQIFTGVGYAAVQEIQTREQLISLDLSSIECPCAIIIKSQTGSRKDLGRPTTTPQENKSDFMTFLKTRRLHEPTT